MKRFLKTTLLILTGCILIFGVLVFIGWNEPVNVITIVKSLYGTYETTRYISIVKNSTLHFNDTTTVGKAFDNYDYFSNVEWVLLKSKNGRNVVQFDGTIDVRKVAEITISHNDENVEKEIKDAYTLYNMCKDNWDGYKRYTYRQKKYNEQAIKYNLCQKSNAPQSVCAQLLPHYESNGETDYMNIDPRCNPMPPKVDPVKIRSKYSNSIDKVVALYPITNFKFIAQFTISAADNSKSDITYAGFECNTYYKLGEHDLSEYTGKKFISSIYDNEFDSIITDLLNWDNNRRWKFTDN
jgi:hypothetical protein